MRAHEIEFPDGIDPDARDLVERLLHPKHDRRLGSTQDAGRRIRGHKWFKGFNWEAMMKREMKAPKVAPIQRRAPGSPGPREPKLSLQDRCVKRTRRMLNGNSWLRFIRK